MKKIIGTLFLFVVGNICIIAQNLSASEILDRTSEIMQSNGSIEANFMTQHYKGETPQHETITGVMNILGQKYSIKTSSVCTWFNGKDLWTLVPENKEVSLYTPTPEELQSSSPTAFLTLYKKGFKLSSKTDILRNRKIWDVTLKAKKQKQEPSTIIVSIDQITYEPLRIRICNNNDWTYINITEFKSNTGLTDKDFAFPPKEYPDFEIIDMR